jgi:CHAT domain-containing protein/Tfp pilus assembly protein PilF
MSSAIRVLSLSLALSLSLICSVYSQAQSSSTPSTVAEPELRAVVEKYFALYAGKDLDGLMRLWSEKSPNYASLKKNLQEQFAVEDSDFSRHTISHVKMEGARASLRATVSLTAINLKSKQKREQPMARNFALVREDGEWKIWRSALAEDDFAERLAQAGAEAERTALIADEKELLTSALVEAMNNQGMRLRNQRKYPQALVVHRLAQSLGEQIEDRAGIARALNNIGIVHSEQNDFAQALEYYKKSLALSEALGDKSQIAATLGNAGVVHMYQGDFAQALDSYHKSLALSETMGNNYLIATTLGNIGGGLLAQGNYARALEYLQKGLAMMETIGDKAGITNTLNTIGLVHYAQGAYAQALESYQKGLAIDESQGNKAEIAVKLNNIGRVHRVQGDYAQALEYYQKSLALSEALGNNYGIAINLLNIGNVHRNQGDYRQALERYRKSLALREAIGDKAGVASTLNNIGRAHLLQGGYAQALEYMQKSLALREAMGDQGGIGATLNNISEVYEKQGRYALALDTASRAAALARRIGDTENLWKALFAAGAAHRALKDPVQTRLAFEEAITVIETLRANIAGAGTEQQRFFESKVFPYQAMVELFAGEGRPAEALAFAERARARVLLDVLQTGRVNVTKAMTPKEQEQERKLSDQLVALNTQISRESVRPKPDQARLTELKAQLQKARLDFEAFQTNLYAVHPELRAQRGEAPPLKIEEAAALLPNAASALLEYVVTGDKTYLFAITKAAGKAETEVRVYTLPVKRDELASLTEAFRRQLAGRDLGFRTSARKLYDLLLKPAQDLLSGKTSLVIAPDDKLWELPFQALLTGDGRFVIEKSAVSYVPSLTVLREMKAQRGERQPGRRAETAGYPLLALGNPAIGKETIERASLALRDEKLDPLPEAENEVKAIGQLYGGARSKVYIGAEAREDRLKAEAAQARVLHFATHGILNNASPMYSHLALARGDKSEDGLLEAWELMQLDLKAELAVLSACETARGRFGAGEGMVGLSWAMFIAGVPAIVVSQWKVESASTRDLMLGFHRQLRAKAKMTKAEALRRAALKLMKNPETVHPFYWAGFVLVGDGENIYRRVRLKGQ